MHPRAVSLVYLPPSEEFAAPSVTRKVVLVDEPAPDALPPSWHSVLAIAEFCRLERFSHIKY